MENKHEISGIKCNVSNCVYHAKDDACEAGSIEVGPCSNCSCTTDTCCNTFKAKNQFLLCQRRAELPHAALFFYYLIFK